jgi:hypothetical protein
MSNHSFLKGSCGFSVQKQSTALGLCHQLMKTYYELFDVPLGRFEEQKRFELGKEEESPLDSLLKHNWGL